MSLCQGLFLQKNILMSDIIERMRRGELIFEDDPDYHSLYYEFEKTLSLVSELNTGSHTAEKVRHLLEQIWGIKLDSSVRMFPPFYTALANLPKLGRVFLSILAVLSLTEEVLPLKTMFLLVLV